MLQIRFYSQIISLTNNTYAQRGKLHTLSSTYIRALLPNLAVGLHLGRWSLIVCIPCVHACLSPLFHGGGGDSRQRGAATTAVTTGTRRGAPVQVPSRWSYRSRAAQVPGLPAIKSQTKPRCPRGAQTPKLSSVCFRQEVAIDPKHYTMQQLC